MPKSIFSDAQEKLQDLLRTSREKAELTQSDLAKKLGKPQSYVSKFESGERRLDVLELREICIALGITLRSFIGRLERFLRD